MTEPRRKRGRPPLAEGEATVRLPIVWVPESLREALRRELRRRRAAVDAARRRMG